jgi:predicted DNA-binding transcriptional regulator AlpA
MPMTHQNNQKKSEPTPAVRLLRKPEILRIAGGVSFVTLWCWMRNGTFPPAKQVAGQPMWLSTDIDQWLENLPNRQYAAADPPAPLNMSLHSPRPRGRQTNNKDAA